MGTDFSLILYVIEGAFSHHSDAAHSPRAMVLSDECVACCGGRNPALMTEFSAWLIYQGVELETLAWKINQECPGADARVSSSGEVIIIGGCSVSTVVLASIVKDLLSRPDDSVNT